MIKQTFLLAKVALPVALLASAGRNMLAVSEANRREGQLTFDPKPVGTEGPDADWAVAGLLIGGAMTQLDEGLPNGQKARVAAAFGALKLGVTLMERALQARGVEPDHIALGVDPPQASEKPSGVFGGYKAKAQDVAPRDVEDLPGVAEDAPPIRVEDAPPAAS
jgi:hypothetical protein